jgi:TMEM175 potassium channel family protein
MSKARLEAFSDGVIAILITIMVLELRVPHGAEWADLLPIAPVFLSYVLSFVFLGIYWNNHHHMLQLTSRINGTILWANLHLLFWLSIVSFATGWMGENHFAKLPTAVYGCVLLASAIAYTILQQTIIAEQGPGSRLKAAVGNDRKGKLSGLLYAAAIPLAFVHQGIAEAIYVFVALIWLVPDRRIENHIKQTTHVSAGAAGAPEHESH